MNDPLPAELREVLACPRCRGPLAEVEDPAGFGCAACGLHYGLRDGVPDFVVEDAVPWRPSRGRDRGGR